VSDACQPIACSLTAEGLAERVEEWRALVASSVQTLESEATVVRMVLDGSDTALLAAAALGQREKACCDFFDVSIDLGSDVRTLTLRVPDGADEVLASFVAMLRA
jgi:MerR family transcriptional regulator, copper efflux regulator